MGKMNCGWVKYIADVPEDCMFSLETLFYISAILGAHDRDLERIPVSENILAPSAGQYRKMCDDLGL